MPADLSRLYIKHFCMVVENMLYFRNGWKTKVARTLNVFVGHSPGTGYPSLCFIPDKHNKCYSKASNFSNPSPKTVLHLCHSEDY